MRKGAFTRRWFKEIPGFPGYWINKAGKIWSMKRRQFIAWHKNIKGYWRAILYRDGERCRLFVHRLTALVFKKNPDPLNKTQANHKDWDIENPHADNMEWTTPSENAKHARRKPWRSSVTYSKNPDDLNYVPF
jgi:hypothetical protein